MISGEQLEIKIRNNMNKTQRDKLKRIWSKCDGMSLFWRQIQNAGNTQKSEANWKQKAAPQVTFQSKTKDRDK